MENYEPPFVITNEIMNLVSTIMEKIGKINVFNELDKLPILRKQNRIRSIHSSCAIEANSLSLDQVNDVINGKDVVGPQKDILEVKNAIRAYEEIENIDPYSKKDLLKIHGIIGKGVVENAGHFRTGNEGVKDEDGNVVFHHENMETGIYEMKVSGKCVVRVTAKEHKGSFYIGD